MKLLLDTHALIWFIEGDPKFSRAARRILEKPSTTALISIASIWEIAIKSALGKLELSLQIEDELHGFLEANGFVFLPIEFTHVSRVASLPFHHRDPFDRLLIAQSLAERIPLATHDTSFRRYGIECIW